MSPEKEHSPLEEWSQTLGAWLGLGAWSLGSATWLGILYVVGLAAFAFALRCMRLLDTSYYYLYSPDSHFFGWMAQRIMVGEGPPAGAPEYLSIHSGLVYPLVYISKAVSFVFSLPSADALVLVSKFLPPTFGAITVIVIYVIAVRIWDRRTALFCALSWALMLVPIIFTVAGYIDRDGLTVLLLTLGVAIIYFSKSWRSKVANIEVGWLLGGIGVLVVQGLLYLEWNPVGPVLLLGVLVLYVAGQLLVGYLGNMHEQADVLRRIRATLERVDWRLFLVVAGVDVVIMGVNYELLSDYISLGMETIHDRLRGATGPIDAAEMTGLSFGDLIGFHFFLITMALGLYRSWKMKTDASILFSSWLLGFGILSLFAFRFLGYAVPAACVVSGIGLSYLWQWRGGGRRTLRKVVVLVLLIFLILLSLLTATALNKSKGMAADENWQDALTYIRESTPQNAVIMSQWSWGYWILEMGQRTPLVDNGYYGYDSDRLRDVASAYLATEPSEAAEIMAKRGTQYLIFSKEDLDVASTIIEWAELDEGYDNFPADSLIVRSLNGEFMSGGGLKIVYNNDEVVILGFTESELQ